MKVLKAMYRHLFVVLLGLLFLKISFVEAETDSVDLRAENERIISCGCGSRDAHIFRHLRNKIKKRINPGIKTAAFGVVRNLTTNKRYFKLQEAIDKAENGDVLLLEGIFEGNFHIFDKSLTLEGNNNAILDGSKTTERVLQVKQTLGPMEVKLQNFIIQQGRGGILNTQAKLVLHTVFLIHNKTNENGGGIDNLDGQVIIEHSKIADNSGNSGGGISNRGVGVLDIINSDIVGNISENGGGIYNESKLELFNVFMKENEASGSGGGIYNSQNSMLSLHDSEITFNIAGLNGGGIFNSGAVSIDAVSIDTGKIVNNTSTNGGGIYNESTLTAINLELNMNKASDFGGGLFNAPKSKSTLETSTVNENVAGINGGGIFDDPTSELFLIDTSVEGNDPDQIFIP